MKQNIRTLSSLRLTSTPTDEKDNPVDIAKNVYCATYKGTAAQVI